MSIHFTYEEQQVLSSLEVLVSSPANSQAFTGTLNWLKTNSQPEDLKRAMQKVRTKEALVAGDDAVAAAAILSSKQKKQQDDIMARALAQTKISERDFPDSGDRGRNLQVSDAEVDAARKQMEARRIAKAAEAAEAEAAVAEAAKTELAERKEKATKDQTDKEPAASNKKKSG